jgi:hypothetical protein
VSRSEDEPLGEGFERRDHATFGEDDFEHERVRVDAVEETLGIENLAQFTPAGGRPLRVSLAVRPGEEAGEAAEHALVLLRHHDERDHGVSAQRSRGCPACGRLDLLEPTRGDRHAELAAFRLVPSARSAHLERRHRP